jgi:hypothetical protein
VEEFSLLLFSIVFEGSLPIIKANLSNSIKLFVSKDFLQTFLPVWIIDFIMKEAGMYAEAGDDFEGMLLMFQR